MPKAKEIKEEEKKELKNKGLIAKRDFYIKDDKHDFLVKKGTDVTQYRLEEKYITNLKTEGII